MDSEAQSLHRFCWLDLATTDAPRAASFYHDLFGWDAEAHRCARNGSASFSRFRFRDRDVATLYQLGRVQRAAGVPSHWTPYVAVSDADEMAQKVLACGGAVLVRPFDVAGVARIALIADPTGAHFGFWQDIS